MINTRKRTLSHQAFILVISLLLFILACDSFDDEPDWPVIESELQKNQDKWSSYGISDYQYIFHCKIGYYYPDKPVLIVVKQNIVTTVKFLRPYYQGESYSLAEVRKLGDDRSDWTYPTIADLFTLIQRAIDTGVEKIRIEYDTHYGYPAEIHYDGHSFVSRSLEDITKPDYVRLDAELKKNRSNWNSYGFTNYQYVIQYTCCGPVGRYPTIPTRISVADNLVDLVTFLRPPEGTSLMLYWPPEWSDEKSFTPQELREERKPNDLWILYDAYYWGYPTIEELFDLMQHAIYIEANEFRAEYDPEYGYPAKVWIDYDYVIDDEDAFDAYSLVPLETSFPENR